MSRDTSLPETIAPGLRPAALAIELALYSAYVDDGSEKLSLLIVAPVGSGKTELLRSYAGNRGVALFNDFTAYGLYSLLNQIQAGLIKHVLVADLVRLTMRGPAVWHQILLTLNALIEEGITRVETFHVRFQSAVPVRAGVIAALTTDEWRARRRHWIRYGFLSRAVPISYHLAPEDVLRGEELIYEAREAFEPAKLDLPERPVKIAVPEEHVEPLKRLGRAIAAINRDETRFRSHKHVLAMAKASALRSGRTEVGEEDVRLLKALSVLWLSPFTGDEACFRIVLELPKASAELVDALAPLYSRATVYRRIGYLAECKAIKQGADGRWVPNL